jgi:hypothetical protein
MPETPNVPDSQPQRAATHGSATATAWRHEDRLPEPDGGTLRVVVGAAPGPTFGLVAGHMAGQTHPRVAAPTEPLPVRDGLAVRTVRRLDRHVVVDHGGVAHELRYLPAAVVTAPDANLVVVFPEDWNSVAAGGFGFAGFASEIERMEAAGFQVRSRLSVARGVSVWGVHFGRYAEVMDLDVVARDVLRASGVVQVDAGSGSRLGGSALDALAACAIPPWSGWVRDLEVVLVVPCGPRDQGRFNRSARDAADLAATAAMANGFSGGSPYAEAGFALVDVERMQPAIVNLGETELDGIGARQLAELTSEVKRAANDLIDVAYVTTSDRTLIAI